MPSNRFLYGVTYYPEHWPRDMWKRDAERMARAGVNVVRMGEGAWAYWEPREGEYQFDLFDDAIDLLAQHGIRTILGTPTYCGPAWVASQYPEVLRWNFDRTPMAHGSRRNYNYTSPRYLDLSDRICSALAQHYRSHKSVIGWQLDNEFNCHMDVSYAPSDTLAFRAWLEAKYRSIDALNDAWGTRFWSQTYNDWSQVDLPHPTATWHNPTQLLDESRFISDCVVAFARRQAAILRKANPRWPITHNGLFGNVNGRDLAKTLDYFSHDHYPLFWKHWTGPAAKLQEARSLTFPFAIMEQQAGPGGQMGYLQRTPAQGEMSLWAMQSVAHGADKLLFFTWRTCPFGSEQHWHGLIDADDRDTRRLAEATTLGQSLATLPNDFLDAPPARVAAVLRDYDNEVNEHRVDTYVGAGRYEPGRWLAALSNAHVPVDAVWPDTDLAGYSLLIAPHVKLIDDALVAKLTRFVRAGGTLVLGAQSGLKDRNNHVRQSPPPGPLSELAGVTVAEWTTLPGEGELRAFTLDDGTSLQAIAFVEALSPEADARTIASWNGDLVLGSRPAIVQRRVGKGQVIYIGAYLPAESLAAIVDRWTREGVITPVVRATSDVEAVLRAGAKANYLVLLNHAPSPQRVAGIDARAKLLTGDGVAQNGNALTLPPFATAVLKLPQK